MILVSDLNDHFIATDQADRLPEDCGTEAVKEALARAIQHAVEFTERELCDVAVAYQSTILAVIRRDADDQIDVVRFDRLARF